VRFYTVLPPKAVIYFCQKWQIAFHQNGALKIFPIKPHCSVIRTDYAVSRPLKTQNPSRDFYCELYKLYITIVGE